MPYQTFLSLFFTPAFLAFVASLVLTPLTIKLYHHFNLLDDPKKRPHSKVLHTKPVPRGGGIPIFISLALISIFVIGPDKHLLGILAGAFVLAVVGILDDIFDLNPYHRLLTGLIAALIVVASGIGIAYITNPLGPSSAVINLNQPQIAFDLFGKTRTIWVLADFFAIIWILWLSNIVNWSTGLDGQMPGFVVIASIFIGLLSLRFVDDITQWQIVKLAAITAGAYLGFLPFNFFPQKIMPGYGGSTLAGYLLAVLSILSGAKVAAMILILGIPTIDAAYTIVRRLSQGKSPVWGDRGHLHHRLLDAGWSKPMIAIFYWLATLGLGLLAINLTSTQKLFTLAALTLFVGGILYWLGHLRVLVKSSLNDSHKS